MNILFICNQNKHRSKTAEFLFKDKFNTKSAGLFNDNPVSEKQAEWADRIIVMEEFQRDEMIKRFPNIYFKKQIISLNIPDAYQYNQPELIDLLKIKIKDQFSHS